MTFHDNLSEYFSYYSARCEANWCHKSQTNLAEAEAHTMKMGEAINSGKKTLLTPPPAHTHSFSHTHACTHLHTQELITTRVKLELNRKWGFFICALWSYFNRSSVNYVRVSEVNYSTPLGSRILLTYFGKLHWLSITSR